MKTIGISFALVALTAGIAVGEDSPAYMAPSLVGNNWINVKGNEGEALKGLKGHVTVLHFWTYGCINCKHNLPSYSAWAKNYSSSQVQVIGVHTPELAEERSADRLRSAIKKLGVDYPVLVDNDGKNWNRFKLESWPTVFIIDKQGRVRKTWIGELGWNGANGFQQLSHTIQALLKEPG